MLNLCNVIGGDNSGHFGTQRSFRRHVSRPYFCRTCSPPCVRWAHRRTSASRSALPGRLGRAEVGARGSKSPESRWHTIHNHHELAGSRACFHRPWCRPRPWTAARGLSSKCPKQPKTRPATKGTPPNPAMRHRDARPEQQAGYKFRRTPPTSLPRSSSCQLVTSCLIPLR